MTVSTWPTSSQYLLSSAVTATTFTPTAQPGGVQAVFPRPSVACTKKLKLPTVTGVPTSEQLTCPEGQPALESVQPAGCPEIEKVNGEVPLAPVYCTIVTDVALWLTVTVPCGENVGEAQPSVVVPVTLS